MCVCVHAGCVCRGGMFVCVSVHPTLAAFPLKVNHQEGNQPTDLEVTKAWSLMACTTSSNLILVVRVQPW